MQLLTAGSGSYSKLGVPMSKNIEVGMLVRCAGSTIRPDMIEDSLLVSEFMIHLLTVSFLRSCQC